VVLLSRDETYGVRNRATVAYVTSRIRDIPVEVPLESEEGLPQRCVVNLDNINTIRLDRLQELIAPLGAAKIEAIEAAIRFALGLPH
jgi:mRNA-degrading endonuclease toxin of MazEF toxin-antitoxin module